jgi:hypothetical protein
MSITTIARQAQKVRVGEVIAKLAEDTYFMRVDNRVTQVPSSEPMNLDTMKLPAEVQQTVDVTTPVENNHTTPTAQGTQLEDPPRAATARAVPAVAVAALVAVTATAEAAEAEAHHTARVEELVAAAIVEAEATRAAMSPATHVAAMMPATKLRRFVAKRLLKQTTTMTSPPFPLDFVTCSFRRNSSLSGSPSTTRSKTQFSGLGVMPCALKTLVKTMTRSASTSEGPIRRTREGGSEWEPIKILLEGDENSNKTNAASNTRLRLTTKVGQTHVATGVPLDLGTNTQPSDPRNATEKPNLKSTDPHRSDR